VTHGNFYGRHPIIRFIVVVYCNSGGIPIETELISGNDVYTSKVDRELLKGLSHKGQAPKATVIACSDSRVPVEIVFNALEPGTFFVIRVAGNIVSGPVVIGSIEFSIRQLKTPYIVLLGHTKCNAVKASVEGTFESESVAQLLNLIKIKSKDLNKAVLENLEQQFQNMLKIECVQEGIKKGTLEAYGMMYDLHTGKIDVHQRAGKIQQR
jgi:carbonic anhydrase